TGVKGPCGPTVEVEISKAPVDELPGSPQVAFGSTANDAMSIGCFRSTTMCLSTNTFVGSPASSPVVLPQPVPRLRSMAPDGPHCGAKSGPVKSTTDAPPLEAAQSLTIEKFRGAA